MRKIKVKRVKYLLMKGDLTLGVEHTMQYTCDVLLNCILETCMVLLTDVTPICYLTTTTTTKKQKETVDTGLTPWL